MTRERIEEKVKEIVAEQLGFSIEEPELKNDATIVNDLGADSLDVVELVMAFEEEFEIELDDPFEKMNQDELSAITVGGIVDTIEKKLKEAA